MIVKDSPPKTQILSYQSWGEMNRTADVGMSNFIWNENICCDKATLLILILTFHNECVVLYQLQQQ